VGWKASFVVGLEGYCWDFVSSRDFFLVMSAVIGRVIVHCRSHAVDFDGAPEFGLWEEKEDTEEIDLRD